MQPRIETLPPKKLVGQRIRMSFAQNETPQLWKGFMPRRKEIKNTIGTALYSLEVYDPGYFDAFTPTTPFDKWAAVEVTGFDNIPTGMEPLTIAGLYAVFLHRGPASTGAATYHYIFETWLPASGYVVDNRPHFALMDDKYKHEDPASEEEVWIPIKKSEDTARKYLRF